MEDFYDNGTPLSESDDKTNSIVPEILDSGDVEAYTSLESGATVKERAIYREKVKPNLINIIVDITQGISVLDIFKKMGLNPSLYLRFMKTFPEFRNAIVQTKLIYADYAERALYKKLDGDEIVNEEVTEFYVPDEENGGMKLLNKKICKSKKKVPADIKAIEMVLSNKDPENWNKTSNGNNTSVSTTVNVDLSKVDVKGMVEKLMKDSSIDITPEES